VTILFLRTISVLAALAVSGQSPALVRLEAGMIVDRSITVRPGTYRVSASPDLARPAITIRGENLTIDFNGAVLAGGPDDVDPDGYAGMLQVISDDGVRVWMDDAVIIDEWTPHESKVSRVEIGGGAERRFKVEYYDVTGFAELRFDIQRK